MNTNVRRRGARFLDKLGRYAYYVGVVIFLLGLVTAPVYCKVRGCAGDPDEARRVLEGAGYSKIEIGGPNSWRCGQDDTSSNTFNALGPSGHYIEGTVCCSWGSCAKGCTIRIDR
jgi:hypothetical protein